jgi:hypothetical protein
MRAIHSSESVAASRKPRARSMAVSAAVIECVEFVDVFIADLMGDLSTVYDAARWRSITL